MSKKNSLNDGVENARAQQNLKEGKTRMPRGAKKPNQDKS